jgi:FkbM family methyltransferase
VSSFGSRLMSKLRGKGAAKADNNAVMDLIEMRSLRLEERSHLEAMIRARTGYAAISPEVGLARVLGRYKMYVEPDDDAISSHLIMDGFWEMWVTIFLGGFVRPGWTVIEVGAHLGYYAMLLSDLVGPTGRLAGFEPVGRNAELLRRSVAVNGFAGRYAVEQQAVSDANGLARVHVPRGNWGGGSIIGAPSHDIVAAEDVQTVTLDSYCAGRNIHPDFIRIDAEGAEQKIFSGMRGLIARQQKLAVMFEFDTTRQPNWVQWFAELEGQGFKLYRVGEDSKPSRISPSTLMSPGICEILALKGHS